MSWEEFYFLLFEKDFYKLIFLYGINFLGLLLFFKKDINNLFDPLNIMIINLSSCFAILIYLLIDGLIGYKYFYQLAVINVSFLITFKTVLSYKNIIILKKRLDVNFFKIYYIIHIILFFLTVMYFYKVINTKLMINKFSPFDNQGLLKYASTFLFPGQLILVFIKREMYGYKNKIDYLIYILIFILFFFSGGRTSTITYFLYVFSILYFLNSIQVNYLYKKVKKYSLIIFILGFIGVIVLFSLVNNENNLEIILKKILHRILSSGDTYYMFYVNDNIKKIEGISFFYYYIFPIIYPILKRIINLKEIIYPGFQIIEVIYGLKTTYMGPNTRYDLVWQMNLGYFGIIGGILSGILMGIIRKVKTLNFIFLEVIVILFVNLETMITDFGLFGKFLFSCIFMLSLLLSISYFIFKIIKCRKKVDL